MTAGGCGGWVGTGLPEELALSAWPPVEQQRRWSKAGCGVWSPYKEVAALSSMGGGGQVAVALPGRQLWEGPVT